MAIFPLASIFFLQMLIQEKHSKKHQPLIVDAFSCHETSLMGSPDIEHVSGNVHIFHTLITSDPVVHTKKTKDWKDLLVLYRTQNKTALFHSVCVKPIYI